jgi:hypothetical protein
MGACFFLVWWDYWYCDHYWPVVPAPDDSWWWLWRNWWNEDWQGKPKYSEKTCPSATLPTTNPTSLDPDLNPGRRGGKPATNCLSYGAATHGLLKGYHYFFLPYLEILCEEHSWWLYSLCNSHESFCTSCRLRSYICFRLSPWHS